MRATQAVPRFIQEITDVYAKEGDIALFECVYSGNPKPDVVWYKNDKLIMNTENVKVRIFDEENRTTLTIKQTTREDDATYVCKATNEVGMIVTKAKLHIDTTSESRLMLDDTIKEEEKLDIKLKKQEEKPHKKKKTELKKAKEIKEKVKAERIKIEKEEIREEKLIPKEQIEEKRIVDVEETQLLETTEFIENKPEEVSRARRIVPIQEPIVTEATASLKKIDDQKPREHIPKFEKRAKQTVEERDSVVVSEITSEDIAPDFTIETKLDHAQVTSETLEKVSVSEAHIETSVQETKRIETKQKKVKKVKAEKIKEDITVKEIVERQRENIAREVDEIMEVLDAKEFGPGESPLRELATIGYLVRQGVSVNEINECLYRTEIFPALKTPDAQNALVQLVERKGHGPLITQVLTEETTTDESFVAATVGFRAFMRMVELQHATVEEVITHFAPEDFRPRAWEVTEISEVETEQHATERVDIVRKMEVHFMEYEDTRQAHTTLRKRKDRKPRNQIEETTQDREEGVQLIKIEEVEEIEKERKREEIEEEVIELERDSKGRLIHEMQLEEIEEFEVIKDQLLPSMVLNVSSQRTQVIPLDRTIEQAPGKPEFEKAKYTLNTVIALTEQMTSVHEKEIDQVTRVKPIERKASISISSIEPYSTTETTAHISTDDFSGSFKATSYEATPSVIMKESLLISETLAHDEGISNLTLTTPETSRKADVQVTVQEAATVRETIVNQSEIPTDDFITPLSAKAEDIVLPQISLSVYEIQEGLTEDKLEPVKTILTKPRVNVNAIEPLMVEEIHSEDKPGKYYPELIVPTEIATETIISQRQHVTEEMNAPEKEGAYIPGRLPPSQTAQIGISYGNETAIIRHDLVQEREGEYIPERKVDSFEATPNVTFLEGVAISTIDTQQKEDDLTIEESKQVTADLNIVEIMSAVTIETMTSEKERDYRPEEKPTTKLAVTSISPLEIGSITDTIVQESEGTYSVDQKPSEVLAETSVRPEEHILISQVQTADYPADLKDTLKYVSESGVVSIQLTEAKTVLETLTHDREASMKEDAKPEIHTIETVYDAVRGIEISQTTSIEKEAELKIFEMPESHRGKTVPTHPMISLEVQETQPENDLGEVTKEALPTAIAKIEAVSLQEMIVGETVAAEGIAPARKDKSPETMIAEISMNQIESLHTTMIVAGEKETEYLETTDVKSAFANTEYMTQVAPICEQVRTESPTEEYLVVDQPVSGKAYPSHVPIETISIVMQETAEKEDVYKADVKPEGKIANIELTETRPGASVLEIIPHDLENVYTPDTGPETHTVESSITGHIIASKAEILVEQSAGKISSDLPKSGKAIVQQETLEELIVTETNVGEAERIRDDDASPIKQNAAVQVCARSEKLTVTEVTTVLKEEELSVEKLPDKRKVVLDITEGHEIAETQEMILASTLSALKEEKPSQESANQLQSGLDVVQQMEVSVSEKESPLETDIKPDIKKVGITFQEGESLTIEITHPEDKEDIFDEKQAPKTAEATIDVVTQNIASTFEIVSDVAPTELSAKPTQETRPKTTLLPFETAVAEEVQTRETEKPLHHMPVPEKRANFEFVMGEGLIVSSVTAGDKESTLAEMEKPQSKSAILDIPTHTVAEAAEVNATDNISELKREETISAMATTEHITHHSIVTSEMSTGDSEQPMLDFVKPDKKKLDVSFEEETSVTVIETIASDKEREYLKKPDIIGEKVTTSFDAHKIAELTEVTPAIYLGDFDVKTPMRAAAKEERLPFESIVQSETVATETEIEFQDKPTKTDTAQISIDEIISATMSTEILGEKEDILQIPERPTEKRAGIQFAGHIIAEKSEVTPDSSAGELMETKPTSISAIFSSIPLEAIVATETQPTEAEAILGKDKIPSVAQADLSMIMEQSVQVSSVILEDKETEYKPKEIPKAKIAEKTLIETHGVAETTMQIANFSTGEIAIGEAPLAAIAISDHIVFNPLMELQPIIQEEEGQFTPALIPENKTVNVNMEEGKAIASTAHITPADKESPYVAQEQPRKRVALFNIDATYSIAETTAVDIGHSTGEVAIEKPNMETVSSTREVYQSLLVTEGMIQDREKPFEDKFMPEVHKIELSVEEGKSVTSVTEIKMADKEAPLETLREDKSRSAFSVIIPGHEVAEKSEIIPSSSTGEMSEVVAPTKVTALIGQKPFETVQLTEQVLVEREINRIRETPLTKTKARVVLDENRFVAITESINAQDVEEEFAAKKLRQEAANLLMEGKEVAERMEINLREGLGELPVALKPIICEAHRTHSTLESIDVSETVPQEQGAIFSDKFKSDKRSAEISFVEGKSITVDHIVTQDKEETMNIPKYEESMAKVKLIKPGIDIAQKTQIFIEQNTGLVKPFEKVQAEAHVKQDAFQSIVVHEVPSAESEGTFDKYPKVIFSTAMPTFEEDHGVFITEITSGEIEASLREKKHEMSQTAVHTIVTEHGMIETTMVESRVDVPEQPPGYISIPQIATPARDTFESIIVNENIAEESEKTFDGLFKPATQKANIDVTEIKPLQVSETIVEDKEKVLDIASKRTEVKATTDINLFQTIEGSFVESIQSTRELSEEKPLPSQAKLIQTTVETIVRSETTPAEREDVFESKFQPERQKGKPQFESLTTVVITEIASNEIEDILPEAVTPKQHQAQSSLTGREAAEILQIVTANTTEDLAKSTKLYEQKGKPGLEELSSVTVSEIISNEVEDVLASKVIPKDRKADFNISGREIAEIIQVTTISETDELATERPEEQKGNRQVDELIPLTISQVISNEAEEILVSAELPKGKIKAQPNLLGRDIAETILTVTMTNAEELVPKKETEKQKGKLSLDEFTPLTISQIESQEAEDILDSPKVPTERTAQTSLCGRDVAETTEITAISSLGKLVELQKPEIQKGKPNLGELLSLSITQIVSNEAEALLPSPEMPTEKMAQTNLTGRDVAETSQILMMMSTEELSKQVPPDERKGQVQVEELSSLTISQVLSHETEETFESRDAPSGLTAMPMMSGREIAETSQVLTVSNVEELSRLESPAKQKGKPRLDEFSSLMVSQVISTETETQLPSLEILDEKIATPRLSGREIAQKIEIVTAAAVENIPELKKKDEQKGKPDVEEMSCITVSEVIFTETEQELPTQDTPKSQKALPKLSSIEVAEMSEVLTVSNVEELAKSQVSEEHKGKLNLDELMPLSIFEVTYNEAEKGLSTPEEPTKQVAEKSLLGMRVAEKSQTLASLTTEEMTESAKPLTKKIIPEQIPFETIEQIESIPHESERLLLPDKKTPSTTADVSFHVSEGVEIIQVTATEKEAKEVIRNLEEANQQIAEQSMPSMGVAEQSQVITSSITEDMTEFVKPEIKRIIPEQIPFESIQQIESISHERESSLVPDKATSTATANVTFRVSEGVEIIQVTATEKETKEIMKSLEEATKQTAEQSMLSMRVAEQSQVIASSTTEEITESVKPEIKRIIPEQIPFESIQQIESILHESEHLLLPDKETPSTTADVSFRISESVEVIQVTATEKETKEVNSLK
ncbi:titin-like [Temnothorax curvispinosus]|uniref:Titin-like n=1 Tax=Temnothorax curvispinosus TaxID=300111 RepID=A0A6J1PGG3_9HYME|nr:titin-like [Temnothorax curvispinosus]